MLMGMKAPSAHALLLTCPAPQQALRDFDDAVAKGRILGTATVFYPDTGHEGANAKIKPYWRRVMQNAQQAAVWTEGRADLPKIDKQQRAVELTEIEFDANAVEAFVAERIPPKPKRGRNRNPDLWAPFWLAAAQLAKAGVLNRGHFPTQQDLCERLHIMIGATLDEQTIRPFAAKVFQQVAVPSASELEDKIAKSDAKRPSKRSNKSPPKKSIEVTP